MRKIKLFDSKGFAVAFILSFFFVLHFAENAAAQLKDDKTETIPVILIHGMGGSDLRLTSKGLFDNGFPNDVLKFTVGNPYNLQFDSSGKPRADTISKDIAATGFYDIPGGKNITDLSKFLQGKGFLLNEQLFEFAYDFRFSVPYNADKLADFIKQIKESTGAQQVDIVGHSMGGLLAKAYLFDKSKQANVRNLIFVGTPHLGSPGALKALRYGDDLNVPVIDGCKLKRVARNLPGMYNLLPGKKYFDLRGGYFYDDDDLDLNETRGLLDYKETLFNLKNGKETKCLLKPDVDIAEGDDKMQLDRLNSALIDLHTVKFHEQFDNWVKPKNVTIYNIVGYGKKTLQSLRESGGKVTFGYTDEGDGTVPLWSAEAVSSDHTYFVDLEKVKRNHSQMIGDPKIGLQIYNLLTTGAGAFIEEIRVSRPSKDEFKTTAP